MKFKAHKQAGRPTLGIIECPPLKTKDTIYLVFARRKLRAIHGDDYASLIRRAGTRATPISFVHVKRASANDVKDAKSPKSLIVEDVI